MSDTEEVVDFFLRSIADFSPREAEEETGISDGTILRMRKRDYERINSGTKRRMIEYLRSRDLLPPESGGTPDPRSLNYHRASRAELAIQHFSNPALVRMLGWSDEDVINAVFVYANHQKFPPDEMQTLIEWRDEFPSRDLGA